MSVTKNNLQIESEICRAWQQAIAPLEPNARIGIGFSGGMDSMVLLQVAVKLTGSERLTAIHICHHLRPEAELRLELDMIQSFCLRQGVSLFIGNLNPRHLKTTARQEGLESAARQARYGYFDMVCQRLDLRAIFLGHHWDDSVETQILGFAKGGGLGSVAGIPQQRSIFFRPFIEIPQADLRTWATTQGLLWSTDSSNSCLDFERNRVRHTLMPVLRQAFPGFDQARRTAVQRLRRDGECLQKLAQVYYNQDWQELDGKCFCPRQAFFSLDAALRERCLVFAISAMARHYKSNPGERLALSALEPLLKDLAPPIGWQLEIGMWRFILRAEGIYLSPAIVGELKNGYLVSLQPGVRNQVPGIGNFRIERSKNREFKVVPEMAWTLDKLREPIYLRPWSRTSTSAESLMVASAGAWYRIRLDRPGKAQRLDVQTNDASDVGESYVLMRETGVIPGE
jgi:tRNA(Ile)-lysidine synthetase-like protein